MIFNAIKILLDIKRKRAASRAEFSEKDALVLEKSAICLLETRVSSFWRSAIRANGRALKGLLPGLLVGT